MDEAQETILVLGAQVGALMQILMNAEICTKEEIQRLTLEIHEVLTERIEG